jgi:hypothetical protein
MCGSRSVSTIELAEKPLTEAPNRLQIKIIHRSDGRIWLSTLPGCLRSFPTESMLVTETHARSTPPKLHIEIATGVLSTTIHRLQPGVAHVSG